MATIVLKQGADPLQVAEDLQKAGITKGQMLPDGRMVVYINRRKWLCSLYPELIPLYEEDRAFWKEVRRRTRQGEDVPQREIEAHAKYFNQQFNAIMDKYEKGRDYI